MSDQTARRVIIRSDRSDQSECNDTLLTSCFPRGPPTNDAPALKMKVTAGIDQELAGTTIAAATTIAEVSEARDELLLLLLALKATRGALQ